MHFFNTNEQFHIVTGTNSETGFKTSDHVGSAILSEHRDYYVIKLNMFYARFYLAKKKESEEKYTLYAQKIGKGSTARFVAPIGKATLRENLKTHLELDFHLLPRTLFMSLFSANLV